MWAARSAKMGYRWKLRNGNSILFWEDACFGNCSLAITYSDLYIIANEQNCSISSVWDGNDFKVFRELFLSNKWLELCDLIASVSFCDEEHPMYGCLIHLWSTLSNPFMPLWTMVGLCHSHPCYLEFDCSS
jgi:hypothetical protein